MLFRSRATRQLLIKPRRVAACAQRPRGLTASGHPPRVLGNIPVTKQLLCSNGSLDHGWSSMVDRLRWPGCALALSHAPKRGVPFEGVEEGQNGRVNKVRDHI